MIICGYPCIGKSTIAKHCCAIDLESSHFKVQGRDNSNWEVGYCNLAKQLSDDGHVVLCSTHKAVTDMFVKMNIDFSLCYPSLTLKELWIKRVEDRATRSGLYKDKLALDRVKDFYEDDIRSLMSIDCTNHLVIDEYALDDPERCYFDLKDIIF